MNVFDNTGDFEVRLFFWDIVKGKLHFEYDLGVYSSLIIERAGNKETSIHLNYSKKDDKSIASYLSTPLFGNLLVRHIDFDIKIGKEDDALFTAFATAGLKSLYYATMSILKTKHGSSASQNIVPVFGRNQLSAELGGIISISIADIIYSYTRHKWICFKTKRCNKKARRKLKQKNTIPKNISI